MEFLRLQTLKYRRGGTEVVDSFVKWSSCLNFGTNVWTLKCKSISFFVSWFWVTKVFCKVMVCERECVTVFSWWVRLKIILIPCLYFLPPPPLRLSETVFFIETHAALSFFLMALEVGCGFSVSVCVFYGVLERYSVTERVLWSAYDNCSSLQYLTVFIINVNCCVLGICVNKCVLLLRY